MKTICLISLLFLAFASHSQNTGLTLNKLYKIKDESLNPVFHKSMPMTRSLVSQKTISPEHTSYINPYRYQDDLGFFCKVELKWDKKLARPFRFRLGSYDYVNRLEGK